MSNCSPCFHFQLLHQLRTRGPPPCQSRSPGRWRGTTTGCCGPPRRRGRWCPEWRSTSWAKRTWRSQRRRGCTCWTCSEVGGWCSWRERGREGERERSRWSCGGLQAALYSLLPDGGAAARWEDEMLPLHRGCDRVRRAVGICDGCHRCGSNCSLIIKVCILTNTCQGPSHLISRLMASLV